MAKKKENLKDQSVPELNSKLTTLEGSLVALRFKSEGTKSKNVKEQASIKKEIAKIKTQINAPKVDK